MKWWAFDEINLEKALARWVSIKTAGQPERKPVFELEAHAVQDFLRSEAAREFKLRGDREPPYLEGKR